jgi:cytochrome c-type biogenesis protein CcmF
VLTSVHAFAVDPTRGIFILMFLVLVIGGSLTLYAWKASGIKSEAQFEWNSREAMLLINNLLLVVATASVLLGTLYPLLYEVITDGKKISVGPPYFNRVFVPIVCLLFIAMAVSPFSRWRRTSGDVLLRQHWPFLLATPVIICLVTYVVATGIDVIAIGVETLAVWILVLLARHWWQAGSISSASQLGMMLAHAGIAVAILGVIVTITYSEGRDVRMNPGESIALAGYDITFEGVQKVRGPNYLADQAEFNVTRDGEFVAKLRPEKRVYSVGQNVMTEADMDPGLMRDVYVALGEKVGDTAWAVRVHVKPFVRWIWLGGLLVALGGFVTLLDKRYRRVRELVSNNVVGTAA